MNISIITVGKLKEKYLKDGIAEFKKRLGAYAKIEIIEVPDEKAPEHLSDADMNIIKQKEGARLLAKIHPDAHVTALAIDGDALTSEQLAQKIETLTLHGKSKLCYVIGGSLGLSNEVTQRANATLSFSNMTFPHQLMRLILLEQLYRSFRIMRGEPYHK